MRTFKPLQQTSQELTIISVGSGFQGVKWKQKPVPPLPTTMLSVVHKLGQKGTCGGVHICKPPPAKTFHGRVRYPTP